MLRDLDKGAQFGLFLCGLALGLELLSHADLHLERPMSEPAPASRSASEHNEPAEPLAAGPLTGRKVATLLIHVSPSVPQPGMADAVRKIQQAWTDAPKSRLMLTTYDNWGTDGEPFDDWVAANGLDRLRAVRSALLEAGVPAERIQLHEVMRSGPEEIDVVAKRVEAWLVP